MNNEPYLLCEGTAIFMIIHDLKYEIKIYKFC